MFSSPCFVRTALNFPIAAGLDVPVIIAQLGTVLMRVTDNLFGGQLLDAVPGRCRTSQFIVFSDV
jgi:Na+-driven multidrug efflux pump